MDRTIAALSLAATVLVGWIAFRATVDTAAWGGVPPKNLEASYIGPTDPLSDLSPADGPVEVRVLSAGRQVRGLRVVQATLRNTGATPILPADMVEPLSVRTEGDWKIVGVANQALLRDALPQLKWSRVDDREFRSERALINPGDMLWATVYLSWTGTGDPPETAPQAVAWRGRIANLKGIVRSPDMFEEGQRRRGPIEVSLWGWGVPFTLASFAIYCWLTVLLLARSRVIRTDRPATLVVVPATALLNVAASEAGTTFVFGIDPTIPVPVALWANLPPLIANAAMVAALWTVARTRSRPDRSG